MYIQINTARTCSRLLPAVVCSPSIPSQHQTQASRNRNHQNGPHSVPASHAQGQSDTPSCQSARAPSSWDGNSTGGSPCGTDDNWVTFNRADRGNLEMKGFPWWLFIDLDPTDDMTLLSRVIFSVRENSFVLSYEKLKYIALYRHEKTNPSITKKPTWPLAPVSQTYLVYHNMVHVVLLL